VRAVVAEVIKHFAVGTARVADRGGFRAAVAAPPVFAAVVVKNALAIKHATGVAVFLAANLGNASLDSLSLK